MSTKEGKEEKSFISEAPFFIKFFFSSEKPLILRLAVAAIIVLLLLYPALSPKTKQNNNKKEDTTQEITKTDLSTISLSTPTTSLKSKFSSFYKIDKLFPVPIDIKEDSKGNIWLISMQDVNFFPKGEITELFKKIDANSYDHLFNNELPTITAAALDQNEDLIIGHRDGQIMRYSNYDWKIIFDSNDPMTATINSLTSFKDFNFIGSKGLWKWNTLNAKLSRYKAFNNETVTSFIFTANKQLFMSTRSSVWLLTNEGWEEFYKLSSATNGINCLGDFGNSGILVGTDKGLQLVSASGILQQTSLIDHSIISLTVRNENSFWAATNKGLKYWENNFWYELNQKSGLAADIVKFIHFDRKSRAWVGIPGQGTFVIDEKSLLELIKKNLYQEIIPVETFQPKLYNNACRAAEVELSGANSSGNIVAEYIENKFLVFLNGNLACSPREDIKDQLFGYRRNDGAVVLVNNSQIVTHNVSNIPNYLPANLLQNNEKLKFIFLDSANRLWLASNSGKIIYSKDNNWENLFEQGEFLQNQTLAITEDKIGRIWLGTAPKFNALSSSYSQAPLHRFDGTNWIHLSPNEGLAGWAVNAVMTLANGDILAATTEGLSHVKINQITTIGNPKELSTKSAYSVNQDSKDFLWLAHLYFGNGINIFDGTSYFNISGKENIFSDNILNISFDAKENVWLTSSNGQIGVYPRQYLLEKIKR